MKKPKNLNYDPVKTVTKGAVESGSVGSIGLLLKWAIDFFRAQGKVPWTPDMDPEVIIGGTVALAWLWKMVRNWRKNR